MLLDAPTQSRPTLQRRADEAATSLLVQTEVPMKDGSLFKFTNNGQEIVLYENGESKNAF